jgi:hypothetical protein
MRTIEYQGVQVQVHEDVEFTCAPSKRRGCHKSKSRMYSAQRPDGTWEGLAGSPRMAVEGMRLFWEMKQKRAA